MSAIYRMRYQGYKYGNLKNDMLFFQICDTCGKSFKTKESLKIHQASHVPFEERKTYFCKICGKVLWKPTSHKAHEEKCSAKGCSKHSLNFKENQREFLH